MCHILSLFIKNFHCGNRSTGLLVAPFFADLQAALSQTKLIGISEELAGNRDWAAKAEME